jgi:hypothetical protein
MHLTFNIGLNNEVAKVHRNPATPRVLIQNIGTSTLHLHQGQKLIFSVGGGSPSESTPSGVLASFNLAPGESIALSTEVDTCIHTGAINVQGTFDATPTR